MNNKEIEERLSKVSHQISNRPKHISTAEALLAVEFECAVMIAEIAKRLPEPKPEPTEEKQ